MILEKFSQSVSHFLAEVHHTTGNKVKGPHWVLCVLWGQLSPLTWLHSPLPETGCFHVFQMDATNSNAYRNQAGNIIDWNVCGGHFVNSKSYTPSDEIRSYLATAECCLINPSFKENHLHFKEKPKFLCKMLVTN